MSGSDARSRLRESVRRLPAAAASRARPAVGRLRARRRPEVSAVVLLAGAADDSRATLDAVLDQPLSRLEVVVVALDAAGVGLADAAASRDWRVRSVPGVGSGAAVARGTGAATARASWLVHVVTGQELLPGSVAALEEARTPGCDLVLGGLAGGASDDDWARVPLLGRVLVHRARWEVTAGEAPDDLDGQATAARLLAAGEHAATSVPTLRDARVASRRSFGAVSDPLPGLADRVRADVDMLATIPASRHGARAAGALSRDLPPFLRAAELAADDVWARLRDHARLLVDAAGEAGLDMVPVDDRVAAWLAAHDRRAALVEHVTVRGTVDTSPPTRVEAAPASGPTQVVAVLDHLPTDVPARLLRLGPAQTPLRVQARRWGADGDGVRLELHVGVVGLDQADRLPDAEARLDGEAVVVHRDRDPAVTRWLAEPHQRHDGGVLVVALPRRLLGTGTHRLTVRLADGPVREAPVTGLHPHGSASRPLHLAGRVLRWRPDGQGFVLEVTVGEPPLPPEVVVHEVVPAPGRLRVRIDAPAAVTVRLSCGRDVVAGVREEADTAGGAWWRLDLVTDPWGLGAAPAPSGTYALEVSGGGRDLEVGAAPGLAAGLPDEALDALRRTTWWAGPRQGLVVRLAPALADDEAGPWAQQQLQQHHARVDEPVDPRLVYFQSYLGQSPTDHPAALQHELHRRLPAGTDVRVLWAVADASVRVPEGAEPVLLRSRAWYDALARAGWVVTNVELDPWFRRRPAQQVLATYHGYPSKAMGLQQWRAQGQPPSQLRARLRRTSGAWNTLLTPIPEMDRYYRENYDFGGRIISQGYPRDDALVAPGHGQRREEVRRLLGLGPHQQVVLYAPTWRDDQATDHRRARAVLHLDVARAASSLGPDHVVLLRGHRFHGDLGRGAAQVLDVSTYPEINDLVLVADVAVLDYSSLRFDFALTGRPMVFLVPDLEAYTRDTRGFLFPFTDSAPGPLVASTQEVVDLLRDVPALHARWAPEVAAFNARYNPLTDGHAAERVVTELFAPLLTAPRGRT